MTRAELLLELAASPFVNAVGVPIKEGSLNEWGDQTYRVGLRKRAKKLVNYEWIHFVVLHEGTGADVACYLKSDTLGFENKQEHYDEVASIAAGGILTP